MDCPDPFSLVQVERDYSRKSPQLGRRPLKAARSLSSGGGNPPLRFSIVAPSTAANPIEEFGRVGVRHLADGGWRVAIKPNLTWIDPRPGVTTGLEVLELVAASLVSAGNQVVIVESNGGYGTFTADAAFERHGLREMAARIGASLVNLSTAETKKQEAGGVVLDMPRVLLEEVDWIVNMPVPKVHVMTRYTGAVKNQWGLIPTDMRLRQHSRIQEILLDLLRLLPPQVVAMDGTYFLDGTGPLEGHPVKKDVMIFADHPVVADIVALRMMGWNLNQVSYLQAIARHLGIDERLSDLPPMPESPFTLHRTPWNWIALAGFKSRALNYLGYESPLAGPLHGLKTGSQKTADRLRSRAGRRHV